MYQLPSVPRINELRSLEIQFQRWTGSSSRGPGRTVRCNAHGDDFLDSATGPHCQKVPFSRERVSRNLIAVYVKLRSNILGRNIWPIDYRSDPRDDALTAMACDRALSDPFCNQRRRYCLCTVMITNQQCQYVYRSLSKSMASLALNLSASNTFRLISALNFRIQEFTAPMHANKIISERVYAQENRSFYHTKY